MRNPAIILSHAVVGVFLVAASALAQTKPPAAKVTEVPAEPSQSSLAVGGLQIASATNLVVVGFDINVASDSIVYSYFLKNAGSTELSLTAAVSMPELQASADRSESWILPVNDPENPVGLAITAAGTPVTTKAGVHAYALGVDRLDEIKAEHLPLIPFGPAVDKALAALSPEAADRLAALGIISPRDPAQPNAAGTADWSLDVVRSWRQILLPGQTTPITVKFSPIKAQYKMTKSDLQDLDDMKDEVCLKPRVLSALQSRLKGGGTWKVTDIALAGDAPAHWVDSPNPTLSVQKPTPDAIVAFCGMDEKTASRPIVLGVASDDSDEIHVVIFQPAAK
jgi:hypothetical protein